MAPPTKKEHTPNGIRVPLWIDGALLTIIVFSSGIQMNRLDSFADDVKSLEAKELPERVARIEENVEHIKDDVKDAKTVAKENQALLIEIIKNQKE